MKERKKTEMIEKKKEKESNRSNGKKKEKEEQQWWKKRKRKKNSNDGKKDSLKALLAFKSKHLKHSETTLEMTFNKCSLNYKVSTGTIFVLLKQIHFIFLKL